jgi:CubicO group peptidase (beta-lactamase class C family)
MKVYHLVARLGCWIFSVLFLVSCSVSAPGANRSPTALPDYWPTSAWLSSSPEQQGMDSVKLVAMLTEIQDKHYPIHGLLIIRNGYLVLEMYTPPFQATSRHYIASATKSFTSALIGIAMEKGAINGLDTPLLDFFPGRTSANLDPRKQEIKLEHLLTMSSGLDWPTQGLYEPLGGQLQAASDGVQLMLDRPMANQPGAHFNYNTGGSLLLSAVLSRATGMSALEYAQQNLFSPLGISDVLWASDPQGITQGGGGLELLPRDMAKFGYLYLKGGVWDGQSIIPSQWVKTSTAAHIKTGYILDLEYGDHWWVHPSGVYHARGYGGQRIFVLPEQQMVVVFVSGFSGEDMEYVPDSLLNTYIIPAAINKAILPPNPKQAGLLAARVQSLAESKPKPIRPLPPIAKQVSGKMYDIGPNSVGISRMSWTFSDTQAWAEVAFAGGSPQRLSIGLDDVYRETIIYPSGSPTITYYSKGTWVSDDTFILYGMRNGAGVQLKIVFKENGLELNIYTGGPVETVSGALHPD